MCIRDSIEIAGTNKKSIDDAMRIIKGIVAVPEVGEIYKGKVRSIMPYGAFVEFLPGKDGLLHICLLYTSISANVPAQTVAMEEEPLDSRIAETTRTT